MGELRESNGARRGDRVQGGEREERRVGDRGQNLCAARRKLSLHTFSERSLLMSISACTFSSSGCEGVTFHCDAHHRGAEAGQECEHLP